MYDDNTLINLLDLNEVRYVIDEHLGLWVKFEVKKITPTLNRPHGVRYSLSLHDRINRRLIGFDNAHAIEYGGKMNVAPKRIFDHWHSKYNCSGRPYQYVNAGKLIEDFWKQVDMFIKELAESH